MLLMAIRLFVRSLEIGSYGLYIGVVLLLYIYLSCPLELGLLLVVGVNFAQCDVWKEGTFSKFVKVSMRTLQPVPCWYIGKSMYK